MLISNVYRRVVQVFLLLILNIFHTFFTVPVVDFEQVNVSQTCSYVIFVTDDPTVSENIEIYEEQLPWWPSVIRVLPLVHTALTENFPSFQRIQFYEYL